MFLILSFFFIFVLFFKGGVSIILDSKTEACSGSFSVRNYYHKSYTDCITFAMAKKELAKKKIRSEKKTYPVLPNVKKLKL